MPNHCCCLHRLLPRSVEGQRHERRPGARRPSGTSSNSRSRARARHPTRHRRARPPRALPPMREGRHLQRPMRPLQLAHRASPLEETRHAHPSNCPSPRETTANQAMTDRNSEWPCPKCGRQNAHEHDRCLVCRTRNPRRVRTQGRPLPPPRPNARLQGRPRQMKRKRPAPPKQLTPGAQVRRRLPRRRQAHPRPRLVPLRRHEPRRPHLPTHRHRRRRQRPRPQGRSSMPALHAARVLDPDVRPGSAFPLIAYNDAPERTEADVLDLLNRLAA